MNELASTLFGAKLPSCAHTCTLFARLWQMAQVEGTPEDVLDSNMCKGYKKKAYKEVVSVMSREADEDIINYACNSVSLGIMKDRISEAKETVGKENNPCAAAMKEQWIAAAGARIFESKEACSAELKDEVAEYRKDGPVTDIYVQEEEEVAPLVGVAICALFCWFSDVRLKTEINYIGKSPSGIPTYTFKYREGSERYLNANIDTESVYFGAMAQDLLELAPSSVVKSSIGGYYGVDYSKIDVDFQKLL